MKSTRRALLAATAGAPLACANLNQIAPLWRDGRALPTPTRARIVEVRHEFEEFHYRAPYQFGGRSVDRVTLLNVRAHLVNDCGQQAWGFGSMTLGNAWSFPDVPADASLAAMMALADELPAAFARMTSLAARPLGHWGWLEPDTLHAARRVSERLKLPLPIPKLCALVVASAFDAAIHDGYGKLFGLNSYLTYSRDFAGEPLDQLGPAFKGEFLDQYVDERPQPTLFVFHSVGASDPLDAADVRTRLDDGLPESLEDWIPRDGLVRFKIKLNGGNLPADLDRVLHIDRVVTRAQAARGCRDWKYSLDFNEGCRTVDDLLVFLHKLKEQRPLAFDRLLYIEQPTARDLDKDRANVMHAAARLRPVVIDESLTDLRALMRAREMGYSGVALKACKSQSAALLMAAAARKFGMFVCVQDLTCPGASLIHSAGLAARVPGNAGIEANARQFVPAANRAWEPRFPGLFTVRDGVMHTGQLTGPGLAAVAPV